MQAGAQILSFSGETAGEVMSGAQYLISSTSKFKSTNVFIWISIQSYNDIFEFTIDIGGKFEPLAAESV